jgi:type I restriction enzyme S subunit
VARLIQKKRRLIELLNERKQAIRDRAVARGLYSDGRTRSTGIAWLGDICESFDLRRFKFVTRINAGQVDPREAQYRGMILIAPNHIEKQTGRILHEETAAQQGADSGKYLATKGQVLYSKIRPALRKAAIAPRDCLCSADMYAMSPDPMQIRADYLVLLLLSRPFTRFAIDCSMRVAMPKVNREALGDAWLWFPGLREQDEILRSIAAACRPLDDAINRALREVELLREYHTRLVADVVTGKLDVRGVSLPASEPAAALPDDAEADDDVPSDDLAAAPEEAEV